MEKGKEPAAANEDVEVGKTESEEIQEALEIVLFQVSECYVYLVSPPFVSLLFMHHTNLSICCTSTLNFYCFSSDHSQFVLF